MIFNYIMYKVFGIKSVLLVSDYSEHKVRFVRKTEEGYVAKGNSGWCVLQQEGRTNGRGIGGWKPCYGKIKFYDEEFFTDGK